MSVLQPLRWGFRMGSALTVTAHAWAKRRTDEKAIDAHPSVLAWQLHTF
jgi:hypothetical protein